MVNVIFNEGDAMLDLKLFREQPDVILDALTKRGATSLHNSVSEITKWDQIRRECLTIQQNNEASLNALSKEIGIKRRAGENTSDLEIQATDLSREIENDVARVTTADNIVNNLMGNIPNIPDADVPVGDESANQVVDVWGEPGYLYGKLDFCEPVNTFHLSDGRTMPGYSAFTKSPKPHWEYSGFDFETAAKMSGRRFTILRGHLARLERALTNFMVDIQTTHGYELISVPYMVNGDALYGTGQLPKFEEDLFKTTDGRYLIPTAEVSLTNMVADTILRQDQLPLNMCAVTPCFRSEAGSAGRDERGMFRQHQFNKLELVKVVHPDQSDAELDEMVYNARSILKHLGIPHRVVLLSTGDMGFSAAKTYDIEVWLPGQNAYREISSCSNCRDFQARRMKARFKDETKKNRLVHTLNGSGLAIGRTLIAVVENYQRDDETIVIPPVLEQYM